VREEEKVHRTIVLRSKQETREEDEEDEEVEEEKNNIGKESSSIRLEEQTQLCLPFLCFSYYFLRLPITT